MKELNDILEIKEENKSTEVDTVQENTLNERNIFNRVFIETLFFIIIYLINYTILITNGYRDNNIKLVLFLIFVSNAIFLIIRNSNYKIVSITYSILISISIIYIVDQRQWDVKNWSILFLMIIISVVFNFYLKNQIWRNSN
jgi:hypothetical protein